MAVTEIKLKKRKWFYKRIAGHRWVAAGHQWATGE
jgi:hypothetical protein